MTSNIEIDSKAGKFQAYLSCPAKPGKMPGLILIHEVWGLNEHIKEVADRFAKKGYAVLAPDLLSHTGITDKIDQKLLAEAANPATKDEAQKKLRAAMAPINAPGFGEETVAKLQACFEYLKAQGFCSGKVGVLGFCFGGTYSYALAVAEAKLSCAVVFYGHAPQPMDKLSSVNCPVLIFNGEQDENLMKQLPEVKATAEKYNKNFEFHQYQNAGHAFFNDSNPSRYNKEAATDAWQKSLAFLVKNLV